VPLVLSVLAAGFSFALYGLFPEWELKTLDYRFRARGPVGEIRSDIVHVDIDDETVLEFREGWSLHARIIDALSRCGAGSIVYDVIFGIPNPEDEVLIEATRRSGRVYYPVGLRLVERAPGLPYVEGAADRIAALERFSYALDIGGRGAPLTAIEAIAPVEGLLQATKGAGHITATPDKDGVFRRIPLVIAFQEGIMPAFTFRVACDHLGVDPKEIEIELGRAIRLGGNGSRRTRAIPVDDRGRMLINFAGQWADTFGHYSAVDLLRGVEEDEEGWREELEGKLCVVAVIATGRSDMGLMPLERDFPLSGLHSNILNTILTEQFIRETGHGFTVATGLLLPLVVAVLSMILSPVWFGLASFSLGILYGGISLAMFGRGGVHLNMTVPLSGIGLSLTAILAFRYAFEERARRRLRSTFQSYLSPSVLEKVLRDPHPLLMHSERKELTILIADMVAFSELCDSSVAPEEIQNLLREYFGAMIDIIFRYEGTVDKFMGDGILAFYGDPIECEDHALRAVRCAMDMQRNVGELNERWRAEGRRSIDVRVGVNTGYVTVGDMGSRRRMEYTVLGREVNRAERLQAAASPGGILIGHRTYSLVREEIDVRDVGEVQGKRNERIKAYEVVDTWSQNELGDGVL